jgi:large subunit ribosomal protein L5
MAEKKIEKVDEKVAKSAVSTPKNTVSSAPKADLKVEKSVKAPRIKSEGRNRLHEKYLKEVAPLMIKKYGFKNVMAVPQIAKITVNAGLGECKDDTKKFENAVNEIALITGQKPLVTCAKKSISNFKLRENQKVGAKVTMRGKIMYEFLDKLITIALPRVRDFRGISPTSFDGRGNYSFGIKEQLVFPEISYEKIDKVRGFDICIVTTAKNDADALLLLTEMGLPFRKNIAKGGN